MGGPGYLEVPPWGELAMSSREGTERRVSWLLLVFHILLTFERDPRSFPSHKPLHMVQGWSVPSGKSFLVKQSVPIILE